MKERKSPLKEMFGGTIEKIISFGIYGIVIAVIAVILYFGFVFFIFFQIKNFNTALDWLSPILLVIAVLVTVYLFFKPFELLFHYARTKIPEKEISGSTSSKQQSNGNQGQSALSELEKIGLKIAMFLVILGIIFVTKLFFKSQGGVVNVTKDIFVGEKTREEIVADSIQKIADSDKDAKKARKRAEDEYIADEYGMYGSLKNDFFGKNPFRDKSDSQESQETEDLTNSVPSKNNDRNSNSSKSSVSVPDPAVVAEQERMRKLFEHQNTDPQGNPIVPVAYPDYDKVKGLKMN